MTPEEAERVLQQAAEERTRRLKAEISKKDTKAFLAGVSGLLGRRIQGKKALSMHNYMLVLPAPRNGRVHMVESPYPSLFLAYLPPSQTPAGQPQPQPPRRVFSETHWAGAWRLTGKDIDFYWLTVALPWETFLVIVEIPDEFRRTISDALATLWHRYDASYVQK